MTITCPSCQASYRIDADALGAGRKVRCARCKAEWTAGPVAQPAADVGETTAGTELTVDPILGLDDSSAIDAIERPDPDFGARAFDAEPTPTRASAGRARPYGRKPLRGRFSGVRNAAVVAAIAIAALGVLVGERVAIVRAAPSLASLYSMIGMDVNVRGLAILDVASVEEIADGVPLLMVTGAVRNVSGRSLDVPRLRLAVTGGGDRELYAWTTVAARARLAPGESAQFRARLASPPAEGQAIAVRFLARQDLMASAGR